MPYGHWVRHCTILVLDNHYIKSFEGFGKGFYLERLKVLWKWLAQWIRKCPINFIMAGWVLYKVLVSLTLTIDLPKRRWTIDSFLYICEEFVKGYLSSVIASNIGAELFLKVHPTRFILQCVDMVVIYPGSQKWDSALHDFSRCPYFSPAASGFGATHSGPPCVGSTSWRSKRRNCRPSLMAVTSVYRSHCVCVTDVRLANSDGISRTQVAWSFQLTVAVTFRVLPPYKQHRKMTSTW